MESKKAPAQHDVHDLHGKVIPYKDLMKVLPDRSKYVNATLKEEVDRKIAANEPLEFLPTYLTEKNVQPAKYEKAVYNIVLMGIFKDGRRATVVLKDIKLYLEVRIPDVGDDKLIHRRGKASVTRSQYIRQIGKLLNKAEHNQEWDKPAPIEDQVKLIQGKPFKYFQEEQSTFVRFYYRKARDRSAAIRLVRDHGYETAHDDLSCYYRVVCRDNLTTFSQWVTISDWCLSEIDSIKGDSFQVSIEDYQAMTGPELQTDQALMKDRTVTCSWDIETWSSKALTEGQVPLPENAADRMFCIGMTFQRASTVEPFLKIALVDHPSGAREDYLTVVCGKEKNLIKGFAEAFGKLRPEFITGFNDAEYDWPWLVERAKDYTGLLKHMADHMDATVPWKEKTDAEIYQRDYRKERVKLEAGMDAEGYTLQFPGYLAVDVRTVYRKLNPTAEKSNLKFFLDKANLSSKEDMPYNTMFRIYTEMNDLIEAHADPKKNRPGRAVETVFAKDTPQDVLEKYAELKDRMADVNKYCVVDAQRCHDLMRTQVVIMDNREVSGVAYCSVYDSFYRANSMKVQNLTIAVGQDKNLPFDLRFTNISNETSDTEKYPGAFVVPPDKGLKISKLSPTERIAKAKLTREGKSPACQAWLGTLDDELNKLYAVIDKHGAHISEELIEGAEHDYDGEMPAIFREFLLENIGRPITSLDFSSLYPSLIRAYNFSPEKCMISRSQAYAYHKAHPDQKLIEVKFEYGGRERLAYFVWHNNKTNPASVEKGGDGDEFAFGLYPYILNDLFYRRKAIKKDMKVYVKTLEKMRADKTAYLPENEALVDDLIFKENYLNSKQGALKVFMNTFYGVAGSKISPFFVLEVAGGITAYGKKNILMAKAYVEQEGCTVHYGDTDSIYFSTPPKEFLELDKLYYTGKIEKKDYWTRMVELTFKRIEELRNGVNAIFLADNGTEFLVMAYEEVLFPAMFTAKKKYFGIEHKEIVNFDIEGWEDLFVRGLEVKKRGVSGLLRQIFNDLMMKCCSLTNLYTPLELTLQKIDAIYARSGEWELKDFLQSAVYRPKKDNKSVKLFAARMDAVGINVPINERFNYVIVRRYPYTFDYRGRKVNLKVGDKMEFAETVEKEGLEVDLDHYMRGSINGQLARLVVYHEQFHEEPLDESPEELKKAEDRAYKNATKFVDEYCKGYYSQYASVGKVYQKTFRAVSKAIKAPMEKRDHLAHKLLSQNADLEDFEEWMVTKTEAHVQKDFKGYGAEYVKRDLREREAPERPDRVSTLCRVYFGNRNGLQGTRDRMFRERMANLRSNLRSKREVFVQLYKKYHLGIQRLTETVKESLPINPDTFEPVEEKINLGEEDLDIDVEDLVEDIDQKVQETVDGFMEDPLVADAVGTYKALYLNLYSVYKMKFQTDSICKALRLKRNRLTRTVTKPKVIEIKRSDVSEVMALQI
jgi:DNA polymerase elongation subunit (family B)